MLATAGTAGREVVHIVGEIRGDKIVARDGIVRQIRGQFRVGAHVIGAIFQAADEIIEIDERVVFGSIRIDAGDGTIVPRNVLLIRFPWNARAIKLGHEMIRCVDVVEDRITIIKDIKLCSAFEPEVIWFAGMQV